MTFRSKGLIVDTEGATIGGYRLLSNSQVTNGDSAPIIAGMPVTIVGDNTVKRASASSTAFANVDGIVFTDAAQTLPIMMRGGGRLNLTAAQWDLVTGDLGGLIPGLLYYLGLGFGELTTSPPTQDGQSVVVLGKALTPLSLVIEIGEPILL